MVWVGNAVSLDCSLVIFLDLLFCFHGRIDDPPAHRVCLNVVAEVTLIVGVYQIERILDKLISCLAKVLLAVWVFRIVCVTFVPKCGGIIQRLSFENLNLTGRVSRLTCRGR